VKLNIMFEDDPKWKGIGGSDGVLGRGYNGNVYVNLDSASQLTAYDARFVLAKELGQANENRFIKSQADADKYHAAIGYSGPKSEYPDFSFLGQHNLKRNARFKGASVTTNPQDFFGNDFAAALGYNDNPVIDPQSLQELQDSGVLPQTQALAFVNPFKRMIDAEKANISRRRPDGCVLRHRHAPERDGRCGDD
jgi:hypothetical protein